MKRLCKLVFFVTVLLFGVDSNPLDSCEWGPSYWCMNQENAVSCGKVGFCNREVWKGQHQKESDVVVIDNPMANDAKCELCEFFAEKALEFIERNDTEEKLKNLVEDVCDYMGGFAGECRMLVKASLDEIWNMAKNDVSPGEICTTLSLCNSTIGRRLNFLVQTSLTCKMCDFVAELAVIATERDTTKSDAKHLLLKGCEVPKPVVRECTNFVESHFDKLWEELMDKTQSSQAVCAQMFHSCPKPSKPKRSNVVECFACKEIVKHFVDEDKIQDKLDFLCKTLNLTADDQSKCTAIVNDIFPLIWKDLKFNDPEEICVEVGLCSSSSSSILKSALALSTSVGSVPKNEIKQVNTIECTVCELLISYIQPYLDSNSTKEEAKDALENLCGDLPSTLTSACTSIVDTYFDSIWNLLVNDTSNVCEILGLCDSNQQAQPMKPKMKEVNSIECTVCQLVVNYIQSYLDSNVTKAEVKDALDGLCGDLPSTYNATCTGLVNTYFDEIWKLLVNESSDVCQILGLCSSIQQTQLIKPKAKQLKDDSLCDLCKLASNFLKSFVDSNSTEAEAKSAVISLCSALPGTYKNECLNLVNANFDKIWSDLEKEVDSDELCKDIGICKNQTLQQNLSIKKEQGIVTCFICGVVIKEIESLINGSAVESEIVSAMEKVCDIVPSSVQSECITLIDTYGKEILNAFISGESPKMICQVVGLCTSTLPLTAVKGDICQDCDNLLDLIKTLMNNDPSVFETILVDFCGEMPDSIRGECTSLVKEYASEIVNIIANAINPQVLCKDVKLCSVVKKANVNVVAKKLPNVRTHPVTDIGCDSCIEMLEELEVFLPKKKDAIVSAVNELCSKYLPETASEVCQFLCNEMGDQIVDEIAYYISPRSDCQVIGVCKARKSPSLTNPIGNLKIN